MVLAVVIIMRLPKSKPTSTLPYGKLLVSMWHLVVEHRALREASLTGAAMFAAFSIFWSVLALLLAGAPFHLGPQAAGLFGIVGAAGAMAAPLAGKFSDRRGPQAIITVSIVLVAISFVVFALSAKSIAGLVIGVIILDVGVQAAQISNQSRIYALKPEARSRVNTVYMVAYFIGGAVGSGVGAVVWPTFGWMGLVLLGLVLPGWRLGIIWGLLPGLESGVFACAAIIFCSHGALGFSCLGVGPFRCSALCCLSLIRLLGLSLIC